MLVFGAAASGACGGGGGSGKEPAAATADTSAEEPLDGASVYDELGKTHKCEVPKNSCPDAKDPPREFRDKCALEGFRIVQCGCDMRCTGNAMQDKLHYDASNTGKLCAKPRDNCEPADTSAAFQDACSGVGGKFVVCGCEWLCTDKLKGAVPGKPPPDEVEQPEAEPAADAPDKAGAGAKKPK